MNWLKKFLCAELPIWQTALGIFCRTSYLRNWKVCASMKDDSFKNRLERAFEKWWKSEGSAHTGEAAMKWAASFTLSEAEKEIRSTVIIKDGIAECSENPYELADRLKRMMEGL